MAKNILNTTSSFDGDGRLAALLLENGLTLVKSPFKRKVTEDEALALIGQYRPVGLLAGIEPITRKVIEAGLPELCVISRVGTGWDQVDLESAKEHGIAVCRTPDAPTVAVTELAIGLMLSVLRKISLADRKIRSGEWSPMMGNLLGGKTVGVIGFGRIGRAVANNLKNGFGCGIVVYDPFVGSEAFEGTGYGYAERLEHLLSVADVVTLHIPGGATSRHLIGQKELSLMKKGAIIINTARGDLISEQALKEALENGHLAGAGLDVFEQEPYKNGVLSAFDSVVMTMHMGSYAQEARQKMERDAVDNLLRALPPS